MQLKRDTDYAVRILYCLHQNHVADKSAVRKGVTISEIAMQTGTPKPVAGRICESLKEKGMIYLTDEQPATEKAYYSTEELLKYSLLDVIEAVEGTGEIFAVFDKRSEAYKSCEGWLLRVQMKTEGVLAKATFESLFEAQIATR